MHGTVPCPGYSATLTVHRADARYTVMCPAVGSMPASFRLRTDSMCKNNIMLGMQTSFMFVIFVEPFAPHITPHDSLAQGKFNYRWKSVCVGGGGGGGNGEGEEGRRMQKWYVNEKKNLQKKIEAPHSPRPQLMRSLFLAYTVNQCILRRSKVVYDTGFCGQAACGYVISVYMYLQRCPGVLWKCAFSCYSMCESRVVACIQCRVPGLNFKG